MKKALTVLITTTLMLSLAACGGDAATNGGNDVQAMQEDASEASEETELSVEEKYQAALQEYELGNFEEAQGLFIEISILADGEYKDNSAYLENCQAMRIIQGQWVAYCYADGDAYSDGLTSEDFKDWKSYYGKLQCARQLYITGWECYAPNYHSYVYGTTDYTFYGFSTRKIEVIDGVASVPMYSNDFTYNKFDTKKELGVPVLDDSGNQLYYSLARDGDGLINVFTGFQKLEDDAIKLENQKITFGYQWGYFAQDKPAGTPEISNPSIGMTKAEAEDSTWGKPEKINTTTTAYGVHEQWVYSGNRYLYFDDGVLTTIQE